MHWTNVFSSQLCFLPGCEQALCGPFGKHKVGDTAATRTTNIWCFFFMFYTFLNCKVVFSSTSQVRSSRDRVATPFLTFPEEEIFFLFFPVFFSSFLAFLLALWLLLAFGFSWLLASAGFWLHCFPLILPWWFVSLDFRRLPRAEKQGKN